METMAESQIINRFLNGDASEAPSNNKLDVFLRPKSVAVIGATDKAGHVGRDVLWNLISSPFGGAVYPVNPKRKAVLGVRAYPNIREVPERIDLAVVVTPAGTVPGIIRECGQAGVSGAVIISAGFRESAHPVLNWNTRLRPTRGRWAYAL